MKPIPIGDLSHTDFDIRAITARQEDFLAGEEHDYLFKGRVRNLLHIITGGSRRYQTGNEEFTVSAGTVLFIPAGTRYLTKVLNTCGCACSGIGICFDIYDRNGVPIQLESGVYRDWNDYHGIFVKLFLEISQCCRESSYYVLRTKSLMFQLLSRLFCDSTQNPLTRSIIAPALTFLSSRYRENLPVKAYADVCSMSESYFRKKFMEYTGMSPIEYRNRLRFAEARRLYTEGLSIQEIAVSLGFTDASYFTKLYKRHTGTSLREDSGGDMV